MADDRGFELPPEVLALVAERGITLGFDIFCQVDQRDVEALQQRLSPAEQLYGPDSQERAS